MDKVLVFFLFAVIAAQAQKRFFDAVAAFDKSVLSTDELAREALDDPLQLIASTGREVPRRFRALFRRQPARALEKKRWVALAAITLMLAAFIWVAVAPR